MFSVLNNELCVKAPLIPTVFFHFVATLFFLFRYVDVDSPIQYVRFHRDRLFHLGALLQNADLQFFFSACAFGMNIFYCYAAPIEKSPLLPETEEAVSDNVFFNGVQGNDNYIIYFSCNIIY